ncbi:glycosyltransferase family 4 protein [Marinospirillum sp.]|uniref:glycosyltransferase family 4 protein n=1 Tax=Marinospirillum sp. TaxID=2183934 RepID=UPI003A868D4F
MRILHVNLAKGFRGGERQTELLIRHLAKQNQDLEQGLVCRIDSPLRERLADLDRLSFVTARHQLAGHACRFAADLVHAHEAKAVHWAWIHHQLKGVPYILTRRVPQPVKDKWFNRLTYGAAACAVAIARPIQAHLQQRGWTQTSLIPSALAHLPQDEHKIAQLKQQKGTQRVIGHAGALVDKHKGQRVLLDVARKMQITHPDVAFWFLGEGVDAAALQAESQDLSQVHWLGFQPDLGNYLAVMDVFAFPSRHEGLGSTLLDVMDAKVPIVATAVDGIPDLIEHEVTGLLVPGDASAALYQQIVRLLEDQALAQALTHKAYQQLADFTPDQMAQRYLRLYQSLL